MKNLKKVLALVVVFTMMLSTVAFAAYPDVAADADYATAVEVLSALKILQGDDQGNFNPDANITRAEFAAVVCRALGLEDSANGAKGATAFEDVAASHWATGYINLANQMGIINGMGDGTFAPEENVTFEQAVKMLTCALGYEYIAQTKGGWPTGYLVVANQYGVTAGVKASAGEPAARSIVAELTYNALEAPLMEQGVWGTEEEWYVYDGFSANGQANAEKKELLANKLGVVRLTGQVVATERASISGNRAELGEIKFDIADRSKGGYEPTKLATDASFNMTAQTLKVGDTLAAEYFANQVNLYVTETSRNVWEILAITEEVGKNIKTVVSSSDLRTDKMFLNGNVTDVWYDEDGKSASTKLEVAVGTKVVVNNEYRSAYNDTRVYDGQGNVIGGSAPTNVIVDDLKNTNNLSGRLTFIDWGNDYTYDVLVVDTYTHAIVESVNASSGTIRTENYGNFNLHLGDDNYIVSIKDVEGNKYDLEEIAEGDVLAIISDSANPQNPRAFQKVLDITVIPAADATVTGTVTETTLPQAENAVADTDKVYVDGTAYGMSMLDRGSYFNYEKIAANSVGTFYLTLDGKIIGFEGDKAASGDYAFILESGIATSGIGAGTLQMKVLTAKGEIVTYDVAKNVTIPVNGNATASFDTTATINTDTVASAAFANTAWAGKSGEIAGYIDTQTPANNRAGILDSFSTPITSVADRFVKINVTSAGKINRIEVPGVVVNGNVATFTNGAVGTESFVGTPALKEYKANSNMWDSSILADNAVVFVLDSDDDYTASTVMTVDEAFINENEYAGYVYDDTNGYKGAAMIVEKGSKIAGDEGFAVVTSVTDVTTDTNQSAKRIRFYQNGSDEEKTVTIVNGEASDLTTGVKQSGFNTANLVLNPGDVFVYSADASGDVDAFAIVAQIDTNNYKTYDLTNYAEYAVMGGNSDVKIEDVSYVYGYIDDITGGDKLAVIGGKTGNAQWDTNGGSPISIYVGNDANLYNYKYITNGKYNLNAGEWWVGNVDKDDTNPAAYSYVLAKLYEGEVIDIIAIDAETRHGAIDAQ